jgi:hypothetical protein
LGLSHPLLFDRLSRPITGFGWKDNPQNLSSAVKQGVLLKVAESIDPRLLANFGYTSHQLFVYRRPHISLHRKMGV